MFRIRLPCLLSPDVFPGTDHPFASQGAAKRQIKDMKRGLRPGVHGLRQGKTINLLEEDKKAFITPQIDLLNGQFCTIILRHHGALLITILGSS